MVPIRWASVFTFFAMLLATLGSAGAVSAAPTTISNPNIQIQGGTSAGFGFIAPFIPAFTCSSSTPPSGTNLLGDGTTCTPPAALSGPVTVCFDTGDPTTTGSVFVNVNNNPNLASEVFTGLTGSSGCQSINYVASNTLIFKLFNGGPAQHASVLQDAEGRQATVAVTGSYGLSAELGGNGPNAASALELPPSGSPLFGTSQGSQLTNPLNSSCSGFSTPVIKFSTGDGSFGAIYISRTTSASLNGTPGVSQGPNLLTIGQFGYVTLPAALFPANITVSLYKAGLSTGFVAPGTPPPFGLGPGFSTGTVGTVFPPTLPGAVPSGLIPVATVTVTSTGGGCLFANPNPVPQGIGNTTTTLRYINGNGSASCIYVSVNSSSLPPRVVFCGGAADNVIVDFITDPLASYQFFLTDAFPVPGVGPNGVPTMVAPQSATFFASLRVTKVVSGS